MSYLLIDLEKPAAQLHDISPEAGAVYLFTKRKRNRQLAQTFAAQHRSAKVLHCRADEKVSDKLASRLKKILKKEPTAGIVVVSTRKKVARIMDKLLNRYPEAEMVLMDKAQTSPAQTNIPQPEPITAAPKLLDAPAKVPLLTAPEAVTVQPEPEISSNQEVVSEISQPALETTATQPEPEISPNQEVAFESSQPAPETTAAQPEPEISPNQEVVPEISQPAPETTAVQPEPEISPNQEVAFESSQPAPETTAAQPESEVPSQSAYNQQAALAFIKKNRPKKKAALLQSLGSSLRLSPELAAQVLDELVNVGAIDVDAAENVKYR